MRDGLKELVGRLPPEGDLADLLFSMLVNDDPSKRADDLTCAIVAGAALEHALRVAITTHLRSDLTETEAEALFSVGNSTGPLAGFDVRLNVAFALGIIDRTEKAEIKTIQLVRNSFAHAIMPISFLDNEICTEVDKLKRLTRPPLGHEGLDELHFKYRYAITCATYCADLRYYRPFYRKGLFGFGEPGVLANALLGTQSPESPPQE